MFNNNFNLKLIHSGLLLQLAYVAFVLGISKMALHSKQLEKTYSYYNWKMILEHERNHGIGLPAR